MYFLSIFALFFLIVPFIVKTDNRDHMWVKEMFEFIIFTMKVVAFIFVFSRLSH